MDPLGIGLLAAYVWLLVELTVFPVPCESSTFQLFFNTTEGEGSADNLAQARQRSPWTKLLVYFLPTALGVVLFLVPLFAVFVPAIVDWLWPLPSLSSAWIAWTGLAVVHAGRLLTFTSVLQLRAQRKAAAKGVQTRGLFELSRNPGLVGMYAFYLGNCLIFPCIVLFVGFIPYVVNMHRRVLMEESWLLRCGGDGFRAYMKRVPRYLPGL